ncbi:MAG: PD40 domain-containing protein, partial [Gemmatimonadetes bacterium]|nr:PD40 domain-containing protein [Gemmatimonadota bacterium]
MNQMATRSLVLTAAFAVVATQPSTTANVTVTEGTSMSVAASRDGRQLAIDLQGSIWLLPVAGGEARRLTDEYNDARQPTWSPDDAAIAFQGYRDGGYDIWAINADGTTQRQLTWGPFDDREPAWSPDGQFVAFSSDRSGNYDIWTVDLETQALRQVTRDGGDDFMPTWSPDGRELAFIGTRGGRSSVLAVNVATGAERTVTTAAGRYDAPSWGRNGRIVYHNQAQGASRLEVDGQPLTENENAFAFRAGWVSDNEIVYVSDGKIRRRGMTGEARTIPFTATLKVTRPAYTRRARDVSSRTPRQARGIYAPALSPDARQVAFIALGDLWVMPVGGTPRNITNDHFLDTEPAWSPDGRYIVWSSDRAGGSLLDLWIHDTRAGTNRRLTTEPTSAMGAAWSRDGQRIAFLDVDGIWRAASIHVVDVGTGKVTKIHDQMFGPGAPTWSIDGSRVMVTALERYSARFREGTNQLLSISSEGGDDRWYTPVRHLSIDSRVGAGPAWSPDGTRLAVIYEGQLNVVPMAPDGAPLGPPRQLTTEIAHHPTWSRDGRHVLYQSNDKLRLMDTETGTVRDVPVRLMYTPSIPTGRVVVHAGRLVDGVSRTPRENVDIIIVGNRIERVVPHSAANLRGARVVDASQLTVMPGLIEFHTHLQKDLGEASMRAYLGFGITTVRSPGGTPYEAIEDREAVESGTRPGPRLFVTGYLMEWQRVYYKMAVAVSSEAH